MSDDAPSRREPSESHANAGEHFAQDVRDNLYRIGGQAVQSATPLDAHRAIAHTVRDRLVERWRRTTNAHFEANPKFVYYLSAEYLLGRQLPQNLLYTATEDLAREACASRGRDLEEFLALDPEPGLGNGGLGRLAACYLDSLATLDIPAVGYGIRYELGIFQQAFEDGHQVERPDDWLLYGNPWEFAHPDNMVSVGFGGHTEHSIGSEGHSVRWIPGETVLGEPYTVLVPGYDTTTVNILRLWRARASAGFDFQLFDTGDYTRAVERKVSSENISRVLYPNDNTPQGKELRLRQQYFFAACSLRDIIRRFRLKNKDWNDFAEKVVIQLNDTHPVVAIPELMRILLDEEDLGWDRAWRISRKTFAYTCHTLLPEALERWPVELFRKLLPRHLEIIEEIDRQLLDQVRTRFPGDGGRLARMAIVEYGGEPQIRMAYLATAGSFAVNGVAKLQSRLLQARTLADFAEMWPQRFQNKTNGVTPRRFMRLANPGLCELITSRIGDGWLTDLERLQELEPHAEDADFRRAFRGVKRHHKERLASRIAHLTGVEVELDSIFDCLVKRLHEYKRQLLQALHLVTLYHRLKDNPGLDVVPRSFIFGAKAAPGYLMAKRIIKLINDIATVVNGDPEVGGRLKVAFLPNFNVSLAQKIYPAADLSEQISMAGKEASGTGNMKFALNGALTIGTLDGANVEIRERVGEENFFLFGLTADEVFEHKERGYRPRELYEADPRLARAIDAIGQGEFSGGDTEIFRPIVESLLNHDEYLLLADYASFVECQERVSSAFQDPDRWSRMAILNIARCGFFSSDRAIRQYCDEIWKVEPVAAT